jgi:membrane protein DedA with SNARE-associated domain/rhodanese-related sulfurtransferase
LNNHFDFLIRYGYTLFFAWVFADQLGLPVPAIPLLLAAGALVRTHQLSGPALLTLATCAAITADLLWFAVGRIKGIRVLNFLCRISLEPDSCVQKTQTFFVKHGQNSLLGAKFLPGYDLVAPPIAGIVGMPLARFVVFDAAGALFYFSVVLSLGWISGGHLERAVDSIMRLGWRAVVVLLAAEAGWLAYKFSRRRRFIRQLKIDRITPEELKRRLDRGERILIVDLRGPVDFAAEPAMIPGALHLDAAKLEEMKGQLAKASEVVLYCDCPNEETSAKYALKLRRKGVKKIRPLLAGLNGWRALGYPVSADARQ